MKRLTKSLIENSIEAFIHALETINRPSVKYRIEAFCFLFCNAWELLLKAKLLHDREKIFYRKQRGKPRRSLSLDNCLNRVFTSEIDPTKLNVKTIHEFRNNATHLVIPFIPRDIMGLFQAGVLNYPKALQEWFGITLSDRIPLGMMVLVYDFDPKQHSLEHARITRKLSSETIRWLSEFQRNIREQANSFEEGVQQKFYIPIDLKLAIIRKPDKADIVLSSGIGGEEAIEKEVLIFEVPKDPDKTHPYRRKEVVELVNQKLNGKLIINFYDILCINRVYNIPSRAEFYYKPIFHQPQYSMSFVDWIINQFSKNNKFFANTRRKGTVKYKRRNLPTSS